MGGLQWGLNLIDITILTKYTSQSASSRYRYFLYINELLQQNVNIEIDSFLDILYVHNLYANNKKNKLRLLFSYFKRVFVLLNSSKNILIEYEALPYVPYFIERLFLKNKNYILNFDDNVWVTYENKYLLHKKFDNLVKNASGVIVANEFLKDKVIKLNDNIIKIPTVIDLESYKVDEQTKKFDKFTIVWIGSPSTYKYIKSHAHIFKKLSSIISYKLVIIATKILQDDDIKDVDMVFYDWSADKEVEILKKSHIGIMPLDADSFSQGKSAFKIIQYLATGLPTVASGIGENCNVVRNNETGFLVNSEDEWINAIVNLYENEIVYNKFSKQAKLDAYEYSIQKYFKEFNSFIKKNFDSVNQNL